MVLLLLLPDNHKGSVNAVRCVVHDQHVDVNGRAVPTR
jgi:hypothetical protein